MFLIGILFMFFKFKTNLFVMIALALLIGTPEGVRGGGTKRGRSMSVPELEEIQAPTIAHQAPAVEALEPMEIDEGIAPIYQPTSLKYFAGNLDCFSDDLILLFMQYQAVAKDLGSVCKRTELLRSRPIVPLCTVFRTRESMVEYFRVRRNYPKSHIRFDLLDPKLLDPMERTRHLQVDLERTDKEHLSVLINNLREYSYPVSSLSIKWSTGSFDEQERSFLAKAKIPAIYLGQAPISQLIVFNQSHLNICGMRRLYLKASDLAKISKHKVWDLKPFSTVVGLTVQDTFTDKDISILSVVTRLQHLKFDRCEVTGLGFELLLPNLPYLRKLWINYSDDVGNADETAKVIATTLPNLEVLDISHITRDGVRYLSSLRLKELWLVNCGLDDSCAPDLGKITTLTHLFLDDNNFTDACFRHLLGLTSLIDVSFPGGNTITNQGFHQFMGIVSLFQKTSKRLNKKRVTVL